MVTAPQDRVKILKQLVKDGEIELLFFDLETSLMKVHTFYIGDKVHIGPDQIIEDTKIITIQYMYEGEKTPSYLQWDQVHDEELDTVINDDSGMIEVFTTNILNKPNTIIVGQNHKDFDHRVLNWRSNVLGLTPPLHDMIKLDTLKLSRTAFRAPSHKLDYRSKLYGFGGKIKMELQDWIDIGNGNGQKLKKMIQYGCKDITDLRSLFWKELPYYEKLPAPLEKLLTDRQAHCPKCEENKQRKFDVEKISGKTWECLNCNQRFKV